MSNHSYSFPILGITEIIASLGEMGFDFTKEELEKPTPIRIREFCEFMLYIFHRFNKSHSQRPQLFAIDKLSQPELFTQDDAIGEVTFQRLMLNLVIRIGGFHDFALKDVYKPEPARIRKLISSLMNLARFLETKISVSRECEDETNMYMKERDVAMEKENRLYERLQELKSKKNERHQIIVCLDEQLYQEDTRLKQLLQIQAEHRKQINLLQNTNDSIRDDIDNIKNTIKNSMEECTRMEALIVPSPDKIRKVLSDMKLQLSQKKDGLKDFEPIMSSLEIKHKQLEKISKNIKTTLELVDNYQKENLVYKSLKKQRKESLKVNTDQKKQLDHLNLDISKYQDDLQKVEDSLTKNKENYKSKKSELIAIQGDLKNKRATIDKDREIVSSKVDSNIKEIESIRVSIAQLKSNYEKERNSIYKSFCSLVDSIHGYHLQLFNLMQNLPDQQSLQQQQIDINQQQQSLHQHQHQLE